MPHVFRRTGAFVSVEGLHDMSQGLFGWGGSLCSFFVGHSFDGVWKN